MKFLWKPKKSWVPFRYGSFHHVPRDIVLNYRSKWFYLASPFDDVADEYPDEYSVYLLPNFGGGTKENFWAFAQDLESMIPIGTILVDDVKFDPTCRKELDASVIDKLLPASGAHD